MASIRKLPSGKWRAEVYKDGQRKSKVCATRAAAKLWASQTEASLGDQAAVAKSFGDLLDRYVREVSPGKGGHSWEVKKVEALRRDPITSVMLSALSASDFAAWRDKRLRQVAPATVRREMNFLSAAINVARREWRWIGHNPLSDVRRPPEPPPRDRLPTAAEIERMAHVAGSDLTTKTGRAFHAFRFACETAMRAGELLALRPDDIDRAARVARLHTSKNGRGRDVPLSSVALDLLDALPPADPVFGLTGSQLDALFRKIKAKAGVKGLRFHDSRHAAITMLAGKLDVLALARMVGHRNIAELQTYYNESAADLARRLG